MAIDFETRFVEALEARKVEFVRSGDDRFDVRVDGRVLAVNTQNIRAEVERDKDPAAIGRFLDGVLAADPGLPGWEDARPHLFPMIESLQVELGDDTVARDLTDRTQAVLVLHRAGSGSLRMIRESDLREWGVSREQAWQAAQASFGEVVSGTRIEVLQAGELLLGTVHAAEPYKASMILSPDLKARIPAALGWPVLAVAPARDFVYLLRKQDEGALGRVGGVVVREFRQSGRPVSTEVWELSDEGAKVVAEFPVSETP